MARSVALCEFAASMAIFWPLLYYNNMLASSDVWGLSLLCWSERAVMVQTCMRASVCAGCVCVCVPVCVRARARGMCVCVPSTDVLSCSLQLIPN